MLRCEEEGYELICMHDPAGRRGIWARITDDKIELCGGREGDDHYAIIERDKPVSGLEMHQLAGILYTAIWMIADYNGGEETLLAKIAEEWEKHCSP